MSGLYSSNYPYNNFLSLIEGELTRHLTGFGAHMGCGYTYLYPEN